MTPSATPTHDPRRTQMVVLWATIAVLAGTTVVLLGHREQSGTSPGTQGSGIAATQARALPPFSGVELGGSAEVDVGVGGEQTVVVHADDHLVDRVTTQISDGMLVISTTGSFSTKSPMRVEVTV